MASASCSFTHAGPSTIVFGIQFQYRVLLCDWMNAYGLMLVFMYLVFSFDTTSCTSIRNRRCSFSCACLCWQCFHGVLVAPMLMLCEDQALCLVYY